MDILYAPWREQYFGEKVEGCVFCDIGQNAQNDEKNKVIFRNSDIFIVMNKYPYTPGHILIVPIAHVDSPELCEQKVWLNMCEIARETCKILYDYGARGINFGANIRSSAGAGIPEHLHLHLLPRWNGDTNFLTSIAQTRSYGVDFEEIYKKIKEISKKYFT